MTLICKSNIFGYRKVNYFAFFSPLVLYFLLLYCYLSFQLL